MKVAPEDSPGPGTGAEQPAGAVTRACQRGFWLGVGIAALTLIVAPGVATLVYLAILLALLGLAGRLARVGQRHRFLTARLRFGLTALMLSLGVSLAIGEVALRFFFKDNLLFARSERNLGYRFDEKLGWFPASNSKRRFTANRTTTVIHNRRGFRDREAQASSKPGVLFLGDSFVWGYDAEAEERFTEKLQAKHADWAIYNFGVSGYGTDQELLLLQQWFDAYTPRVVVLVYCTDNDRRNNSFNFDQGSYKPYYTANGQALELEGLPVPRSAAVVIADHPILCQSYLVRLVVQAWKKLTLPPPLEHQDPTHAIISELQAYAARRGAFFAMGLTDPDPGLQRFLTGQQIPFLDLSAAQRYGRFGCHWTPEGHTLVCARIDEFLTATNWLIANPGPISRVPPK